MISQTKTSSFLNYGGNLEKPNRIDLFLDKTLLWIIPSYISPNQVTIFRYVTIPIIIYLLTSGFYVSSFVLFIISAFSDAVDGALARTRNKITDWGKINDPMADKLLVGSVGIILITKHLSLTLLLVIVGIEILLITNALYKRFKEKSEILGAVLPGKIKMVIQSLALMLLFIYSLTFNGAVLMTAEVMFYIAIFFALVSLFVYKSI